MEPSLTLVANTASFPVVALGASAGGLEALRQLFAHLPETTGMAFIVIQHLDPARPSRLTDVLAADRRLPVVEATDGAPVEPERVYVIPPDADLGFRDGALSLLKRRHGGGPHLPIDGFMRALAEDRGVHAIGVVLSGTGADGTDGLKAIKAAGGITFAQDPSSAQFRGMPESAIASGMVDFQLPPAAIAEELARLARDPYLAVAEPSPPDADDDSIAAALAAIRRHAVLDFAGYKRPTIQRRIARRMALRHADSLRDYAASLRDDPVEARALAQDILIHVTTFFRDPSAFDALADRVLPDLVDQKPEGGTIRVWVPGCSTGQEAYSLAIRLLELVDRKGRGVSIKLFGSDLSARAIETARAGLYSPQDVQDVPPDLLARFFDRTDGGYRICRRARDACVFVKHDLTRDPPFARLDLISCRNVLIYFDVELQRRVLPVLHHCLTSHGYLFLGRSETINGFSDLFAPVDKESRIFLKIGESPRITYPLSLGREAEARLPATVPVERRSPVVEAQRRADHVLLSRYAPPGVVVNERMDIVQFRGRTAGLLEAPPGQPQTSLLRMAQSSLVPYLHEAFEAARARSAPARREGVQVRDGDQARLVNLEVVPLPAVAGEAERFYLVLFEEASSATSRGAAPAAAPTPAPPAPPEPGELSRLHAELGATRDYLQSLVDEHQVTVDELAASNEELIAANEELQSTNEEFESTQEELQSTNEELTTVNDELRLRNDELHQFGNDLVNVLESVHLPILIVDAALRIRRFTPTASGVARLIPADVGRSIDDVRLNVRVDDLGERIRRTIAENAPREWEVEAYDGRWLRMQIRPYRTSDNRLDGAIVSFIDVDVLKRALRDAESARDYARNIVETVPTALLVIDPSLRVVSANRAFFDRFACAPADVEGARLFELAAGAWRAPALREAVERSLSSGLPFRDLELRREFPGVGRKSLSIAGRSISWNDGGRTLLVVIDDVTERRLLEEERAQLLASEQQARREAERANHAKDLFLATLSHELRTPLSSILLSAQALQRLSTDDPRIQRASGTIVRSVGAQARLIDDLLDVSRIVSGKLLLDLQAVDLASVVRGAIDVAREPAEAKGIRLDAEVDDDIGAIYGDPTRLQQVVGNLLTNAVKFTARGGRIAVRLAREDERAQISVSDNGIGIRADVLPHLFNRFVQADSSMTRTHGGLGLGLSIVRHLVEVHGGTVQAESPGEGRGATFRVSLPLATDSPTPAAGPARSTHEDIAGVGVLLIEDDDDTREALSGMLAVLGADVRSACGVAEAFASLAARRPAVILCDIAMPGEDGYSFIRRLRALPPDEGGQIPAAAVTALAGDEDRKRALRAGFQLHVAKPVDAARLASTVHALAVWSQPIVQPANGA